MLSGCVTLFAPFTSICAALLFSLHFMLHSGNTTLTVLAVREEWSIDEKGSCCLKAGLCYLFVSLVLWCLVAIDSLLINLSECGNWRKLYQGSYWMTVVYLYRRRQSHRSRAKSSRSQRYREQQQYEADMATYAKGAEDVTIVPSNLVSIDIGEEDTTRESSDNGRGEREPGSQDMAVVVASTSSGQR